QVVRSTRELERCAIGDGEAAGAGAATREVEITRVDLHRAGVVERHADGGGGVAGLGVARGVVEGIGAAEVLQHGVKAVGIGGGRFASGPIASAFPISGSSKPYGI